ncbi:MAG: T9SS type A sorting domain-containing protein [Bacteroidales bacterium]
MMKKLLLISVFFMAGLLVKAQWVPQTTNFSADGVGISYMDAVDANIVWAMGYDGISPFQYLKDFVRTTNGGTTWTPGVISGYATYGVSMLHAIDGLTAWAPLYDTVNNGGVLLKTTDGGATWVTKNTAAFPAPNGFPNVVHFFNATEGFCMGDPLGGYYEIYTTNDAGETWTRIPSASIPAPLSQEWGVIGYYSAVGDNVWFGTNKSRVFRSNDKGHTWAVSTVTSPATFIDVDFHTATHGIAHDRGANSTGAMYETLDGGVTWNLITVTGPHYTYDFSWIPGTFNACVSTSVYQTAPGMSFSVDGGHTWTDFNGTTGVQLMATDWVSPETGWVGGYYMSTDPVSFPGMYKYAGDPLEVLQIDPEQGGMVIYPNPGNGNFTLTLIGFENQEVTVSVYNTLGQCVYSDILNQNLVSYNEKLDLSALLTGTYIAVIQSGTKLFKEKLVIR